MASTARILPVALVAMLLVVNAFIISSQGMSYPVTETVTYTGGETYQEGYTVTYTVYTTVYTTKYFSPGHTPSPPGQGQPPEVRVYLYSDGSVRFEFQAPEGAWGDVSSRVKMRFEDSYVASESLSQIPAYGTPDILGNLKIVLDRESSETFKLTVSGDLSLRDGDEWYRVNLDLKGSLEVSSANYKITVKGSITTNNPEIREFLLSGDFRNELEQEGIIFEKYNVGLDGDRITVDMVASIPGYILSTPVTDSELLPLFTLDFNIIDYYSFTLEANESMYVFKSESRTVGGIKEVLDSFINKASAFGDSEEIRLLRELAENFTRDFEVVKGSELVYEIGRTTYFSSPRIKAKGVENPLDTLIRLRDMAVRAVERAGGDPGDVIELEVTLLPGDGGVKSINPQHVTLGELEQVQVEVESGSGSTALLVAAVAAASVAAIVGLVVVLARKS